MSGSHQSGNSQVVTPQYTGIQTQASSSALPVPILWGMTLVAPNVVWAGDFFCIQQSGGYHYFTALVLGLCEGPIAAVRWGYDGQSTYSLYQLDFSVIKGTTPQTPWGYLQANHPQRALAYPGTALLVSPIFDLGSAASIGTLSFEVVGALTGTGVTKTDADPAQVIFDFLTNPQYGVGFPAASIDATTLYGLTGATYQAYCAALGIALSPVLVDQEAASSILAFKLSWECCLLEPMDIVTLTDANLGLAKTPVRIVEIAEDGDGLLSVTAEEYPGGVASTPGYAVDPATNEGAISRGVTPAPVNAPVLFEPPSELTGGVAQLRIGASGGTGGVVDPNWGGATVFVSTDNATYTQIGVVPQPSRMGVLTAAIGAPPGTTGDTLQVSFAQSGATIVANAMPTLVLVDGEVMSFTSATLTGTSAYTLGGLSRKLYGQRGGAHAVGASVLVLDTTVFTWSPPPALVGVPLWLKLASFNVFGTMQQDLATCTAYPVTLVGSGVFGPVAQAIAAGTSFDAGLTSSPVTQSDDDGLASDPYTRSLDMGLASEATASLAVQSGGTGATSAGAARASLGAAASGANADITSLSGLTTPLSLGQGGTSAATAATARGNLGAAASGANADITSLTGLAGLGIGTAVDTVTNLFSMKSAAALFDNAGAGVTLTLNKATAAATAAHLFQTGYSGRAQAGLVASDRYRISVSADGTTFRQALDIDPTTGNVGLAGYTADANNALGVSGTAFLFAAATDSVRFTFSKKVAANDATLSFQTNFSARALLGTTGSDAFQLKVSPDGATFYQAFVADQVTGNVAFKALVGLTPYAVAALPTSAFNGAVAFASNGRKTTEVAGSGTGVVVAYSNGAWRRLTDDTVVAS